MGDSLPYLAPATAFMATRGYGEAIPRAVERVGAEFCWYLDYTLPEGELVLEVSWSHADGWSVHTWDFRLWER